MIPTDCNHVLHREKHHFDWDHSTPPALTIMPGESVDVRIADTSGGEITPETKLEDIDKLNMANFTPLTGPIAVDGAQPGDALKIAFLGFRASGWGWSMITPRYGILRDQFRDPFLKIWRYDPSCAEPVSYKDIARIPLKPFPGIIGVAPEMPGNHSSLPPYVSGGNLDIRDLSEGTALFLPVFVPGGLLSLGDTHAVQGHGELAGTALESPIDIAIKVELVKAAGLRAPRFETAGPLTRHVDKAGYHATCGVSPDLTEAARSATSQMIDLLGQLHHMSAIDAYLLCSLCGDLVINEMVNHPVHVVSLYFPRAVLE